MNNCGCKTINPEEELNRWEIQCSSYIEDASNYYTKYQVDELLEEIESGITSGCCITPEEVDEKIESAKTEIEGEIPSLSGYATEQWVEDKHYISGVDLSDYALKSEIPTVPTSNTAFTNDAGYLTEHQHLKTINNQSLVGDGNIEIGTGGTIVVDNTITSGSSNPVTSSSIYNALDSKADTTLLNNYMLKSKIWCGTEQQYNQIQNKDSETLYLIHA